MGKGGLMLQAAIGGQEITFEPKPKSLRNSGSQIECLFFEQDCGVS
jgi:hypothetical protein